MRELLGLLAFILVLSPGLISQENNISELLGYDKDAKLLIVHADDLGVSHSVNQASIKAMENGAISSASIMVPCPWFSEIAQYAKEHPEFCWGLHLTLTSEWKYYKWDGVASSNEISSLLNSDGHFYESVIDVVANANLVEVEKELRGQIEKAFLSGINVSHLDSHMGSLFATPELFKLYVELGNEYDLPVLIPGQRVPPSWNLKSFLGEIHYPIDQIKMAQFISKDWTEMYDSMLEDMQPGLTELIVHLGYDDAELQSIMIDHPSFGATWRQNDFDYVSSAHFEAKLKEEGIQLVSWQDIRNVLLLNSSN